jgi:hypothetical protein
MGVEPCQRGRNSKDARSLAADQSVPYSQNEGEHPSSSEPQKHYCSQSIAGLLTCDSVGEDRQVRFG